jgi:sugar phosphate isomerase/epimerase
MPPLSLQIYSLRNETDLAATLRWVAAQGFAGVEIGGSGSLSTAALVGILKETGLRVSGLHIMMDKLRSSLDSVILEARQFGCADIILPWYPKELLSTVAACEALGRELDGIGSRLVAHGMRLHYHNHGFELARLEGQTILEWILGAAAPRNLLSEPDVFWLKDGGVDPAAYLRRLGSRARLIHLKDAQEIGTGPVDFPSVFKALDEIGCVEWQVLEVEWYNHEPRESVRRSLARLREYGRA